MKTLTRTSILIVAVAGLLALMAGTAVAAPAEMVDQDWQHEGLVDQMPQLNEEIIQQAYPLIPQPGDDDGGADDGGADDGGADDGGDDDDGADTPGIDEGGDDGGQDTPGIDDGDDDTVTPPADSSNSTSTGKLPNTGTSMALLVAFALAVAGVAYVARRAASKRVR